MLTIFYRWKGDIVNNNIHIKYMFERPMIVRRGETGSRPVTASGRGRRTISESPCPKGESIVPGLIALPTEEVEYG
jgi:hypothetical protein